jgi:hypothetical protein
MPDGTRLQVVGIAEDGKYTGNPAEDAQPTMFLPILQAPANETWLVLRSSREPQQRVAAIRSKLRDLDTGLPAFMVFIVYQATPRDPLVLAGVVLAMASLGLLATWIPAQRALSINLVILLHEE